MKMQDSEFDELFRSKLDNFETEPSGDVWENIDEKLNSGRRKKMLTPILSVAATILVLIVAGILFIPQKGNDVDKHLPQIKVAKATPVYDGHSAITKAAIAVKPTKDAGKTNKSPINTFSATMSTKHHAVENESRLNDTTHIKDIEYRALGVATPANEQNTPKAVVPDENIQIIIKQPINETPSPINKPVVIATIPPPANKQDTAPANSKRKIRTLGDIINVVVAKVDKRKDKVIEFSDEDDESNLTGVNLGIIKFKKDQ
ncbi:MAG TPA: hypothetical protein VGI43_16010 [Mucilaginibacter sp.]|jgi:hypothetical protein